MLRVLAIDLGASSARVAAVDLDASPISLDIVHRYPHSAVDGRWDWNRLTTEVEVGLRRAVAKGPVASIGVDTWGVDYGLVDARGALVAPPYSYRHDRTANWRDVAARIGEERLYTTTGIQLLSLNTIFQLAAHDRAELARTHRLLMLPELLVHRLTGAMTAERTSAGTTGLVDMATGTWSTELIEAIDVDPSLFLPIQQAGTRVGEWEGIPVHLVGGHDTASAVAGLPGGLAPDAAFVSSGTWMLVGRERPEPDVSAEARAGNFSNEPAVFGGVRFLKNVPGLWLFDRCREMWASPPLDELLDAAASAPLAAEFDPTEDRFLDPGDMEAEVRAAAGLPSSAGRGDVVAAILRSLASATARVVVELGGASEVAVVGGGARNALLTELIGDACGATVRVGSSEATALGNALVQGVALGRFSDLDEARQAGA